MNKVNVLVFPCGAENALEIHASLSYSVLVNVWGGSSVDDHGRFVYENYIGGIPYIQNENFIEEFNSVIQKYHIDIVFPTHDTVALFFAENRDRIHAKVIVSDKETALICREKLRTYHLFKNESFTPEVFHESAHLEFPVFLKPNIGEGGKNTTIIKDREDFNYFIKKSPELLILEYLPGLELTVDCFTDRKGVLRFIGPRTRTLIKMGISFNSKIHPLTDEIKNIADTINKKLRFRGLWFFQLKQDKIGNFKLLEISTRLAGTMSLYRQLGVNFSLLSVFDVLDQDVEILFNHLPIEVDRCLKNSYILNYTYDYVYVDFDDTIIVNGVVNELMILFLYQCIKHQKKIILLTKHEKIIDETLTQFMICKNIFSEIIHISPDKEKHEYITRLNSVFIDNAFKERKKVKEKLNIPVFDVDAVECLMN